MSEQSEINKSDIPMDKFAVGERANLKHDFKISNKYNSPRYTFRERVSICILIFGVVCLLCIGVIFITKGRPNQHSKFCLTDECLRSAASLKQTMNFNADPCDDFYEYVCGNWAEERPENDNGDSWVRERQLKIYRNIRTQLERNVKRFDPKPVAQAKTMYQSCLNSGQRKKEAAMEIAQFLHEFGLPTVPSLLNEDNTFAFDWVSTIARVERKLGLDVFIGLYISNEQKNNNRTRLTLYYSIPKNPFGKVKNDKEETSNLTKLANKWMRFSDAINLEFNSTHFKTRFMEMGEKYMTFFSDLPGVARDNESSDEEEYDFDVHYSIQELQSITDSLLAPNESLPIWKHYFEELFTLIPDSKPTPQDKLAVTREALEHFKKLAKVISHHDARVVELYIWDRVVTNLMWYEFDEKKSKDICAKHVQSRMGSAVSYLVADENFLTGTKPRVEQLLNDVRDAFNVIVMEADWIDGKTKNATLEKSMALRSFIGFPEWIMDIDKLEQHFEGLQIYKNLYLRNIVNTIEYVNMKRLQSWRVNNKTTWSASPIIVNAYNYLNENAIYIPVAFIQYPFYYLGLEALNYGALGWTLGHELTHSFDDNGRFYDKFGNKKPWWSTQTHQEYELRASCMVEQYNSYSLPEGPVNGTITLGENIADNGGLREAFLAYQTYVKRNGQEPMLPGFENFNHEQLFFISFAHQDCETLTSEQAEESLEDTHSPTKLRTKGVLSNMVEFSAAFQCAPGKAMNPEKKCRVW